jgi:Rnl2 family RNA ligase
MEFSYYSHMDNEYKILKTQDIQEILSNHTLEFVALEKIHGTNFSFITNGIDVQCCRRSDILKLDESFFNWQNILNKYKQNIINLFGLVKKKLRINMGIDIIQIQLYGELYGGNYPGTEKINGNKSIQKGIYYSNSYSFASFDLKYFIKTDTNTNTNTNTNTDTNTNTNTNTNTQYLNWDLFEEVLTQVSIPIVPVIARDTWNKISKLNPKFESQVYKLHGLDGLDGLNGLELSKIPNNWAEGFVIKPVQEIYLKRLQERLIWKFKNPLFSEISKGIGCDNSTKQIVNSNPNPNPLLIKLEEYVCENRYDNVVTKVIEGTSSDKVVELFYQDVWVDFIDDLVFDMIMLTDLEKKECEKKLKGLANKFVRKRYSDKK